MSETADNNIDLKSYGLSDDEAKAYLFILKQGFSSALHISRSIHLARTKVYRILDKLIAKRLVEQKIADRGMRFGATDPEQFNHLVAEKERELTTLKQSLPHLVSQLQQLVQTNTTTSKVLYYQGIEGLKQISYNITHSDKLLRVFEMEHLSEFLPKDFAEDVRQKLVDNKIFTKDLTNKQSFGDYTDITEMIKDYSEFRYIDPTFLKINFEVLIYNNVYATYTYKNNQIFCVEIYNEQLAEMQKQIYDAIWNQAQPMQFTSEHGATKLITRLQTCAIA